MAPVFCTVLELIQNQPTQLLSDCQPVVWTARLYIYFFVLFRGMMVGAQSTLHYLSGKICAIPTFVEMHAADSKSFYVFM